MVTGGMILSYDIYKFIYWNRRNNDNNYKELETYTSI